MAITNAQQYQQLVNKPADGKRPGYRGRGSKETKDNRQSYNAAQAAANVGRASTASTGRQNPYDVGFNVRDAQISKQYRDDITPTGDDGRIIPKDTTPKDKPPPKKPKETEFQKFKRTFNPFPLATSVFNRIGAAKFARINNAKQRQNYIDSLDLDDPEDKKEYDRIMNQLGGLGMDIIAGPKKIGVGPPSTGFTDQFEMPQAPPGMLKTQFKTVDGVSALGNPGVDDILGTGYDEYLNRFNTEDTGGRDDRPMELDPCKGPNPPAYCFIGENADETQEDVITRNLAGLSPRIGGSIFDFSNMAEGGLAEMDREAFLLGGIAKGLKKAVRGVKKLAKSPIGKAAILGAVGFGLGSKGALGSFFGRGSFNPFLRTVAGDTAFSGLGSILSKAGLVSKAGLPTFKGGIAFASILPLLVGKTDDEKDQILKDYYASQKLTPATTVRQAGSEFDFYNYNLAEGGTPRKEPVAKKVMPLLDMDGMEKDYREEGGFVPIGRMEKADDVPARLSKNEFVFTADAVRNAGDGDVDKGAEVMYNMMKNLEAGGEVSEESQGLDGAREMFQTSQRLGEVI